MTTNSNDKQDSVDATRTETGAVFDPSPTSPIVKKGRLPYSNWWPLACGAIVGTVLRLAFSGAPGGAWSAISWSFISFAPLAVSAVTIYVAKRDGDRTWMGYFTFGAFANMFFVIGTLLIMIEGLICAIIIVPLFMLYGGVGGLIMGAICKWTDWPKSATYGFVSLPLVLALLMPATENKPLIDSIERTVTIASRSESVWAHLMNAERIRPDEVDRGRLYRIDVPLPEAEVTLKSGDELVRKVTMG